MVYWFSGIKGRGVWSMFMTKSSSMSNTSKTYFTARWKVIPISFEKLGGNGYLAVATHCLVKPIILNIY